MSKIREVTGVGDVIEGDNYASKAGSAQERYYRHMLLKEKLSDGEGKVSGENLKILQNKSERERIEIEILRDIMTYKESSPEFSQLVDLTGSRDVYAQAQFLAETVYDKMRAEEILGFYTPSKDTLRANFAMNTGAAIKKRADKVANIVSAVRGTSAGTAIWGSVARAAGAGGADFDPLTGV